MLDVGLQNVPVFFHYPPKVPQLVVIVGYEPVDVVLISCSGYQEVLPLEILGPLVCLKTKMFRIPSIPKSGDKVSCILLEITNFCANSPYPGELSLTKFWISLNIRLGNCIT